MTISRAKKIKVIIFDVDGVLTDGSIWLFPAGPGLQQSMDHERQEKSDAGGYSIAGQTMMEAKGFHAHDGAGVMLARLAGLKVGVITRRTSEAVALRARDLKLDYVYQGQANKVAAFRKIAESAGVSEEEMCFVGDDIVDLPVMRLAGLAMAVPNARVQVLNEAHWVTAHRGGDGAGRDAIEYVLSAQGKLQRAIEDYMNAKNEVPQVTDLKMSSRLKN